MPDTAEATQGTRAKVQDAYELAQYVVQNGIKDTDGNPLAFDNIKKIQITAAKLGIVAVGGGEPNALTVDDWTAFELAYYELSIATSPVTAETLRNTRYVAGAGTDTATGEAGDGGGSMVRRPGFVITRRLKFLRLVGRVIFRTTEPC